MSLDVVAISASLLSGLATAVGALPIFIKKEFDKKTIDLSLGFSAGIMLVASFVSLIIPAISESEKLFPKSYALLPVFVGIAIGYFFIIIIHDFLPHEHLFKKSDMSHRNKFSRMTLIALAVTLHNLPEGMSVGVGFGAGGEKSGVMLAIAIALQNMPEGFIVAFGMISEGATKKKAFLMALLSGLVEPIAALFGYLFSSFSLYTLPLALGFAAGAMLFVICQEMFPELFRQGHERYASVGVVCGLMTMIFLNYSF